MARMSELFSSEVDCLVRKLGILDEEVLEQHKEFLEKYPAGFMTKSEFLAFCMEKDGDTEDVKEKAEQLFNVFDGDENGTMDFMEYAMASNATTLRSA